MSERRWRLASTKSCPMKSCVDQDVLRRLRQLLKIPKLPKPETYYVVSLGAVALQGL